MTAADSTQDNNLAAVLKPGGSFYYENRELPAINSDRDVIVKIIATGLCGSDVHYWQHGRIGRYVVEKPIILGHESTGIVVACGDRANGIAVGDRVALEPGVACNTCDQCRKGRYNLCRDMRFAATPPIDGTLCTYYRVPAECCFKLPAHISLSQGALVEPLSVAVHACRLAGDLQTKSVIVFGAGPVGLLCCAVARAFGATNVIAVDIVSSRLTVASKYGATHTYQMSDASSEENASDLLKAAGLEDGADVILDATGAEPCMVCGLHAVAPGGTFIQVGLGRPSVTVPIGQICDKEVTLKGSFRYGPGDFQTAVGLLEAKRVNVDGLVTHNYSFSQVEEAFQNVANRVGIKSVIYGPEVKGETANAVVA
ncbi:NAD(P)-dependent alcohol dehydrogenase [Aspergillus homomorphus CBS 101889]|uniref:D-xylulose reductase n=1 Tax=Aspergillus homomorphus (strain CBS 101889) TaxID=1450537 RepID=A0A395HVP1_ASPHC|nr:putative sorbitol/xylitol dehydrogenase [Aspergillus homomorphus CBS 101889]RAL11870.1 putative sorbitol/xylitol dehydrogenase [Aspergillus homomorphus CBS 101889]